ncbi:primosomal protein N' [Ponticaulis sp.]|uniref:primosomal protein N' n=1 Tax=Ponticaulis sp. TaxID=2020902 RepID=UPI00262B8E46|nr:primosomal protein N' [Ponticaulis sp.]MDF1679443.1 primosomal protein N' [Ponticaulis sp.]
MRYARVLFTLPLPEPFDYAIPEEMHVEPGSVVRAPLGAQERMGVVWDVCEEEDGLRELKELYASYPTPAFSKPFRDFIEWSAKYTCSNPGGVLRMVLRSPASLYPSKMETVVLEKPSTGAPKRLTAARERVLEFVKDNPPMTQAELGREVGVSTSVVKGLVDLGVLGTDYRPIDPSYPVPNAEGQGFDLTDEQESAAEHLRRRVREHGFNVSLIDGVTGSGKTEVYFEAISEALRADPDAQILILLPEIALTQAIMKRFEARFGARSVEWHSGITDADRRRAWREVAHGRARIVVGARSALFLPFPNLRLAIVDEEHDGSYKQEDGVIYHARNLCVARARFEKFAVILASATPALETLHNARTGRFDYLRLAARPGVSRLPEVSLIDMRSEAPDRGDWLSPVLVRNMADVLSAGEQSLLFLNRRGYAPLVICKACGEKLKTPGTESWLTEHRYTNRLVCHLTGFSMRRPAACPKCGARDSLMGVGPGIERVAEEVRSKLPQARIELLSSDTIQSGDDLRALIHRMEQGQIDVLIGTQMIAKGHNFPGLTLVGVVDADASLKGGDLRAGERTFQLLSQVAGRAGRAEKPGRAMLQTYDPDASLMQALAATDRDSFLACEEEMREMMGMPPYGRLAAVILSFPGEDDAARLAKEFGMVAPNADGVEVWGPAPAPIGVLRGRWRWRFLVRSELNVDLSAYMSVWKTALRLPAQARLQVDIDPYSFL